MFSLLQSMLIFRLKILYLKKSLILNEKFKSNQQTKQKNFKSFPKKKKIFLQNFLIRTKNEKIDFFFRFVSNVFPFSRWTNASLPPLSLTTPSSPHTKMFDFFLYKVFFCVRVFHSPILFALFMKTKIPILILWNSFLSLFFLSIYPFILFVSFHFIFVCWYYLWETKEEKRKKKKKKVSIEYNNRWIRFFFLSLFSCIFPFEKKKRFWILVILCAYKNWWHCKIVVYDRYHLTSSSFNIQKKRDSWKFFGDFLGFLIFFDFFW